MISKSIERYCCEDITKIENYEQAIKDHKMWQCHHRLETHFSDGTERPIKAQLSTKELKALDMYFNRPASELIFLTIKEHRYLHMKARKGKPAWNKGKHHSEESKKKMSEAHKGKTTWNKGKYHSNEAKKKMSKAWNYEKHFTEETRKKISEANKGKHWKLVDGKRVWY